MRKLILLLPILLLIASCENKHADYQLRILIRNGTDSIMTVKLFPKEKYMKTSKYEYSDINSIFKDTVFVPAARLGTELYITDDMSMEPHLLAAKIFDSINVRLSSDTNMLRFSPQRVVNYPRNLFTDKESWFYERNKFEHVKMWRDNYIESDDYIFVITFGD